MTARHYAVERRLDWKRFAERYWDRRPVLFRGSGATPYRAEDALRAAARAAVMPAVDPSAPAIRFALGRRLQPGGAAWAPRPEERSFGDYARRVAGDARYALIVNYLHHFSPEVWRAGSGFFHGLWRQVGLPLSGAITTLFHGSYESTPVGVHKDRFATFMFPLQGRKRMRFWARRPWDDAVTTRLDYGDYLQASFAIDVEPGDILYWPASYYHVGETTDADYATSVNVGIPRDEHKLLYDLEQFAQAMPARNATRRRTRRPEAFGAGGAALPAGMASAWARFRQDLGEERLRTAVAAGYLQLLTGCGFVPAPPAQRGRGPGDGELLRLRDRRFPIAWTDLAADRVLCGAGGHVRGILAGGERVAGLFRDLNSTGPASVAELLAPFADAPGAGRAARGMPWLPADRQGMRALLGWLAATGAVERMPRSR
ncbi:JmjC domain-containing protein [Luteimonas aquatica]|uniref:JmjC domain-containing protein n=1 Tax=Luteimonas aquatica TaxID=450364 RepID=UPI001F574F78|nr:cupin domain-containing protein [Luteimonas aquatica]